MKRNEKLNVTDARMERATAAPSGSAQEIATPQSATEVRNNGSDGFISKKELAFRLKVTVRTISNWQRRGLLPFVKCRRAIYYAWPAVAAHLRARARVCSERTEQGRWVLRIPVIGMAKDLTTEARRTRRRI